MPRILFLIPAIHRMSLTQLIKATSDYTLRVGVPGFYLDTMLQGKGLISPSGSVLEGGCLPCMSIRLNLTKQILYDPPQSVPCRVTVTPHVGHKKSVRVRSMSSPQKDRNQWKWKRHDAHMYQQRTRGRGHSRGHSQGRGGERASQLAGKAWSLGLGGARADDRDHQTSGRAGAASLDRGHIIS
jgi:hypothetical protein